jgi:hypothetical protein
VAYWSTERPFIDRLRSSHPAWNIAGQWIETDWVRFLQPSQRAMLVVWQDMERTGRGFVKPGTYRLRWQGNCRVTFTAGFNFRVSGNEAWIDIAGETPTLLLFVQAPPDAVGHFHDASLVHAEHAAAFDAGRVSDPDWERTAKSIEGLRRVRTMHWQGLNDTVPYRNGLGSTVTEPSDVPRFQNRCWTVPGRGMPPEALGRMFSEWMLDAWLCMPHAANDAAMREYLAAFWAGTSPAWRERQTLWLQYGNEVWNSQYAAFEWLPDQAIINNLVVRDPDRPDQARGPYDTPRHWVRGASYAHQCLRTWRAALDVGIPLERTRRCVEHQTDFFDLMRSFLVYRDPGLLSAGTPLREFTRASARGVHALTNYYTIHEQGPGGDRHPVPYKRLIEQQWVNRSDDEWHAAFRRGIDWLVYHYETTRRGMNAMGLRWLRPGESDDIEVVLYEGATHFAYDTHRRAYDNPDDLWMDAPWLGRLQPGVHTIAFDQFTNWVSDGEVVQQLHGRSISSRVNDRSRLWVRLSGGYALKFYISREDYDADRALQLDGPGGEYGFVNHTRREALSRRVQDFLHSWRGADLHRENVERALKPYRVRNFDHLYLVGTPTPGDRFMHGFALIGNQWQEEPWNARWEWFKRSSSW